jgi:gamma-glutamyl-gamma-aminobutyrate hydrolase PuuD
VVFLKPVILITSLYKEDLNAYCVNKMYCRIILRCGAVPFILPFMPVNNIPHMLKNASGVLLTGGGDLSPRLIKTENAFFSRNCDEKRDIFELALSRYCLENAIPIMGICRGMQILCAAAGGSIKEDISLFSKNAARHVQTIDKSIPSHKIYIEKHSILYNILNKQSIYVNSLHHQCVENGGCMHIVARSSDGVAEAAEKRENGFAIGLQWHPEHCLYGGYSEKIFKFFIKKCV